VIIAILQARMSSTRLPGKVLMPILGWPMLARQIERVARSRRIDRLVVATSDDAGDDPIAALADQVGVGCHRGSLSDVLDRFHGAAAAEGATHLVRLTGDCPLADWDVIDRCIDFARDGGYDYASNALRPTWPDGLDVEVVTVDALEAAWREAETRHDREHVMPFLTARPDRFRLGSFEQAEDHSALRWTVDEPRDIAFVDAVYRALYPANSAFTTADILALVARHPALGMTNAGIARNAGSAGPATDEGTRHD
jgi:spore coat polysaccharide biosynthesis protein SpsF